MALFSLLTMQVSITHYFSNTYIKFDMLLLSPKLYLKISNAHLYIFNLYNVLLVIMRLAMDIHVPINSDEGTFVVQELGLMQMIS